MQVPIPLLAMRKSGFIHSLQRARWVKKEGRKSRDPILMQQFISFLPPQLKVSIRQSAIKIRREWLSLIFLIAMAFFLQRQWVQTTSQFTLDWIVHSIHTIYSLPLSVAKPARSILEL